MSYIGHSPKRKKEGKKRLSSWTIGKDPKNQVAGVISFQFMGEKNNEQRIYSL